MEELDKELEQVSEEFYRERFSDVDTMIVMDDEAKWHVSVTMIQGRRHNGTEEWDTREITFTAEEFDIDKALADATLKGNFYLDNVGWDLFALPTEKQEEKEVEE